MISRNTMYRMFLVYILWSSLYSTFKNSFQAHWFWNFKMPIKVFPAWRFQTGWSIGQGLVASSGENRQHSGAWQRPTVAEEDTLTWVVMSLFIHQQVTLAMLALTLAALVGDVYRVTSQPSYFEFIFMFPLFFTEDDDVIDEMSCVH